MQKVVGPSPIRFSSRFVPSLTPAAEGEEQGRRSYPFAHLPRYIDTGMRGKGVVRRISLALLLVVAASLGAWSATALGQGGLSTLPTVSVPTLSVTVPTVPPPPPVPPVPPPPTLPTPPTPPPVTVTVPPAPVPVPPVSAPNVPVPSLPGGGSPTGAVSNAAGSLGSAGSARAGSAGSVLGFTGQGGSSSSGGSSASGESPAAADGSPAEQQSLTRRRATAAERVRGTKNVRPVPARFTNRGPNRRSTVLVFWLERPGRVVFTVLDASNGCRVLGSFAYRGHAGVNRVRYRGRLNGKPLGPGRYTLVPRVYRGVSVTQLERVTIQVLPPGAKAPLWRRSALVPTACRGSSLAGVYDSASIGSRFAGSFSALARNGGSGSAGEPGSAGAGERSGDVAGAEATNPDGSGDDDAQSVDEDPGDGDSEGIALPVPFGDDSEGPPPLVAAAVLTGLGLAIMMLIVLLVRYVRGSWNP
jgi:hypothetical protein